MTFFNIYIDIVIVYRITVVRFLTTVKRSPTVLKTTVFIKGNFSIDIVLYGNNRHI